MITRPDLPHWTLAGLALGARLTLPLLPGTAVMAAAIGTLAGLVTVAVVTATVNLRYVLMTASLRPWIGDMPAWRIYPALLLTVDANWIVAMRYRGEGGSDI